MANAKRTLRIEAFFDNPASIEEALSSPADEQLEDVIIEDGIRLTPLFLSIRTSRIVGGAEALAFLITVSSSIAAKSLADVLYKWFKKTKASRLKIERTEVMITRPDEVIRVIREVMEKDDSR